MLITLQIHIGWDQTNDLGTSRAKYEWYDLAQSKQHIWMKLELTTGNNPKT